MGFWSSLLKYGGKAYIEMILARKEYPEQLYKSCMGVLALGKRHGNDRLIDACRLGLKVGAVNYTFIKNALNNRTERLWMEDAVGTAFAAQHPVQQVQPVSVRKTVFEGSEPAYPDTPPAGGAEQLRR